VVTHGSGCRFQEKGFSVYMTAPNNKALDKCDRCKAKDRKCADCRHYSNFVDRGFILIDKRVRRKK
jgi:hypothetical protein